MSKKVFAGAGFPKKDSELLNLPSDNNPAICVTPPHYRISGVKGTVASQIGGHVTVCGGTDVNEKSRELISHMF